MPLPKTLKSRLLPSVLGRGTRQPHRYSGGHPEIRQRKRRDLPEGRSRNRPAVDFPLRLIHNHRNQQLRILSRRKADERSDVLGLGVSPVFGHLRGPGLPRQLVAGHAHRRGGTAGFQHPLEHFPHLRRHARRRSRGGPSARARFRRRPSRSAAAGAGCRRWRSPGSRPSSASASPRGPGPSAGCPSSSRSIRRASAPAPVPRRGTGPRSAGRSRSGRSTC